ncbi:hypothetical protein [Micromonospora sp. WMMD710]|nr:hypothetical protein [Micromonospora sp. WMMD710]MDG4761520.1 hypothetical protein [Micromonospora sp. WMMD710]
MTDTNVDVPGQVAGLADRLDIRVDRRSGRASDRSDARPLCSTAPQ